MKNHNYYIYILSSKSGVLYIGMTNDLVRRLSEHKQKIIKGFTEKYNCNKLVYYEHYKNIKQTILREKQLKKWNRSKKENLIKKLNKDWEDLSEEWV